MSKQAAVAIQDEIQVLELKDLLISEEDLQAQGLDQTQIFEIAIDEEVVGLAIQKDFKSFLETHPDHYANTYVRTLGQDVWIPAVQHPLLQRRKPTLVKQNDIAVNEKFYVLKEGQKVGPYTVEELKAKLEHKEILITEMLIPEKGGNWFKLFELNAFDRRFTGEQAAPLPQMPTSEILNHHETKKDSHFEENDAIAGLAYIGHLKSGKISETKDHIIPEQRMELSQGFANQTSKGRLLKKMMTFFLVTALFATAAVFVYFKNMNTDFTKIDEERGPASVQEKVAPTLKPIKVTSGRTFQLPRNNLNIARPTTFGPTLKKSNFIREQREKQLSESLENEPIENDPIRSQLSEETLNPQPIEPVENQNWVNSEALPANNPSETPFDAEVTY